MESETSEVLIENQEKVVASEDVSNKETTAVSEMIPPSNEAVDEKTEAASVEVADTDGVVVKMETEEIPKQPAFGERRQDLYSSERFKVELNNLGKFSYGELRKLLKTKLNLKPTKLKTATTFGGRDHAFICFRNEEDRKQAMETLEGYKWKGREIHVKFARALVDPLLKKRQEYQRNPDGKPRKTVLEASAPFAHLPYDEQIARKEAECLKHLQSYASAVKKYSQQIKPLIQQNEKEFNGLPCKWNGFKKSPQVDGYRNKCEFSIGKDANGQKTIGFRLGSYNDGSLEVGSIYDLPHIPERTKLAVRLYEAYVNASKYDIFSVEFYTGQFRQLGVRLAEGTGEIMLIIGLHTADILDTADSLLEDIVQYFTQGDGKELNVTSIFLEEMNKREIGQVANKFRHIYGAHYINETILGLKFRISAASFFQINTKAAEVLYGTALEMGKVDQNTSVLDICCGTGSIGLCFAKHCKDVFGVEIVPDAITDAKYNAKTNEIDNAKFFTGNCDDYIISLTHQAKNTNLLAIIDPPRAGLKPPSKDAIRNANGLNRFIYIACAPHAALKNWIDFSRPCSKSLRGEPFVLKEATGVDMFPHTDHQEMVLLFERLPKIKERKPVENTDTNPEKLENPL